MRKMTLVGFLALSGLHAFSQQKEFEGTLVYTQRAKSTTADADDNMVRLFLTGGGERLTVQVKQGNYKQSNGSMDCYYIKKDKRLYYKFKALDTLYYQDYGSDTTTVTDIVKSDSGPTILNFPCKTITLKKSLSSSLYYYTNSLYISPENQDSKIGNLDVFSQQTGGGVWLYAIYASSIGNVTDSCIAVEQKPIDDRVFDLPALPKKDRNKAELLTGAHFPGKEKGWINYLTANLNTNLALDYLEIPKGQKTASAKVMVAFMVLEDGSLTNIHVLNKQEVPPRLAQEAMRVIRASPAWVPAIVYGVKTKFTITQPVVFMISK